MFKANTVLLFSFVILSAQLSYGTSLDLRKQFKKAGVKPLYKEAIDRESLEVVELGRLLFFDKILSGNKDISCATCHHTSLGSSDGLPLPMGAGGNGLGPDRNLDKGHFVPRNAPAAFNLGYKSFHTTMWDGRIAIDPIKGWLKTPEPKINGEKPEASKLASQIRNVAAAQALFPVTSHHEMRGLKGENEIADAEDNLEVWARLTERLVGKFDGSLGGIQEYKKLFLKVYPELQSLDEVNFGHAARAIAAFEIYAFDAGRSPFDKFLSGKKKSLSFKQIEGAKIFAGKGNCLSCHSGPHLTDFSFHSLCAPQLGPGKESIEGLNDVGEDRGLAGLTNNKSDLYKFKTPTLRNVEVTGPWLHAGSYDKLEDVIYQHIRPRKTMKKFLHNPSRYLDSESTFSVDYSLLVDQSEERNEARLSTMAEELRGVKLKHKDVKALVAFLKSLTDRSFESKGEPPLVVPSELPVAD
ncbi:MAG: cytochrome-c peroxidase [Bdellovibrionales bacterium]